MKLLGKTYEKVTKAAEEKKLKTIRVELTSNELDLVLSGLMHIHQNYSVCGGYCDEPIEYSRPVSDLYYNLKY